MGDQCCCFGVGAETAGGRVESSADGRAIETGDVGEDGVAGAELATAYDKDLLCTNDLRILSLSVQRHRPGVRSKGGCDCSSDSTRIDKTATSLSASAAFREIYETRFLNEKCPDDHCRVSSRGKARPRPLFSISLP